MQELHVWRARLDTSVVRCRGGVAATQDMLASESARARADIAAICDAAELAINKGGSKLARLPLWSPYIRTPG